VNNQLGDNGPATVEGQPQPAAEATDRARRLADLEAAIWDWIEQEPALALLARSNLFRQAVNTIIPKVVVEAARDVDNLIMAAVKKGAAGGDISDGSHTFDDLYRHRAALFAALCRSHPGIAWRSRQHHTGGEPMFSGYFIAGLTLPDGRQASYHVREECWNWFDCVAVLEHAPEWDGHTQEDVIERLNDWAPVKVTSDRDPNVLARKLADSIDALADERAPSSSTPTPTG
jgi:hypothetical protein